MGNNAITELVQCFHCGEDCTDQPIQAYEKDFCCQGCKMVYEILNQNGLCNYYDISKTPGINQRMKVRANKFSFLDDENIKNSLTLFKDAKQTHVTFYLPQIHCSSCLWLLENLHRLNENVISSKVNFTRKETDIVFNHQYVSMRTIAELLTAIGYEPYISLNNATPTQLKFNKSKIYKLGVAAFCFGNIMLLSFPEYLGIDAREQNLISLFRYINLLLSLPVFFYAASEFYLSAWKSLRHRFLSIDIPIVLAIGVTFVRSVFEVLSNTGSGYFDSMSGVVLFMLVGRVLQDKTYEQLSFERDYTSYFPIAVTKVVDEVETTVVLPDIKLNDTLLIHNQELIPADGLLTSGKALIDYSFVTGESLPVEKEMGELVYAGGKQIGTNIEILVVKEVAQSYLTKLWNREELQDHKEDEHSFVHFIGRYFTWLVLFVSLVSAVYWYFHDPSKIWVAATAVLIVACPCALLLSNTLTNGNILRILGRNHLYLRNAQTIEDIANVDYIVFDKTGTLTTGRYHDILFDGKPLSKEIKRKIAALASQSTHPMSKAIAAWTGEPVRTKVVAYEERPGKGVEGIVEGELLLLGSKSYVAGTHSERDSETAVYISVQGNLLGKFTFSNQYRKQIPALIKSLNTHNYQLALLSGDNAGEKEYLQSLLGFDATILFHQKPEDKLEAIKRLQQKGKKVMMVGDGLNDAGALKQANVGIAITENSNNFTPASDAILEANQLQRLYTFIRLCKHNKKVVMLAFFISFLYNIVGNYYAVMGNLSPMRAAILMPCSSISILLITFGFSNLSAWKMKLQ